MVTLSDVAKQAGVSKSTVSRYLNNGQVSAATAEKIKKVIEETNYQPNQLARSLKATTTGLIGVIIPRYDSPSTAQVLKGIDEGSTAMDKQLLITSSNFDPEREKGLLATLDRQKVEGIICLTKTSEEDLRDWTKNLNTKVLVVGQEYPSFHHVAYDDYAAGYSIAEHAVALGHEKILFVGLDESDEAVGYSREAGFKACLDSKGLAYEQLTSNFSQTDNYLLAKEVLKEPKWTYIACATDQIAIAFLKAAKEAGLSVPGDLSLSGFGGYKEGKFTSPSLTSMNYPYFEAGKIAIEGLLADQSDGLFQKKLTSELYRGDSTSALIS